MRAKPGGGSPGLTSDLPFDSPDSESRVRSMGGGGGRGGGSTDVWRKRKRDRGGMTVVMNGPDENHRGSGVSGTLGLGSRYAVISAAPLDLDYLCSRSLRWVL